MDNNVFEIQEVSDTFYNPNNFTPQRSVRLKVNAQRFEEAEREERLEQAFDNLKNEISQIVKETE